MIFPNYILDRKLSTGGDGENRRHVLSIKCKDLGATTLYITDEEGCTIAYNINVVRVIVLIGVKDFNCLIQIPL